MRDRILKKDNLTIVISKPGMEYSGSRFDWTGIIRDIEYKGHSFCTKEQLVKNKGTGGIGFCNEFGIDKPIGYDEIGIGESFPKIGTGLITKENQDAYDFFAPLKVQGLEIIEEVITEGKYKVSSVIDDNNGYTIKLSKIISIDKDVLSIFYFLENEGSKKILTNEYNHNFISIDGDFIGENYSLYMPQVKKVHKVVGDYEVFDQTKGKTIEWKKEPNGDFYGLMDIGEYPEGFNWELKHHKAKVGIRECSGIKVSKMAVWGYNHVVCPELFIDIDLEPNTVMSWTRSYEFFEF